MSRLKGGRSVKLRGTAFESELVATLPLYGLILKWGISVVFIAKVLPWVLNLSSQRLSPKITHYLD